MNEDFESFFDPTRREQRRESKAASKADRSKYKLSNLQKREKEIRPTNENLIEGRVILIRSQNIEIATPSGIFVCTLRGTLKQEKHHHKNLIIVGDLVLFTPIGSGAGPAIPAESSLSKSSDRIDTRSEMQSTPQRVGEAARQSSNSISTFSREKNPAGIAGAGLIHHVLPRTSVLSRQDHLNRIKKQLVAANVDQVIITMSIGEPSLRPSIIDRYIVAAEKGNLYPAIVINKIDLREKYPEESVLLDETKELYTKLGFSIVCVSARTGEGMQELQALLKDKVSVFSGQSGSGKTLIVNALTGLSLQTQAVRSGGKGAHTTTSARLLPLSFGGWCIDTPGIRSFGIWDFQQDDLLVAFPEIAEAAVTCYFKDCKHTGESGCHVAKALEAGAISPLRYASYLSLLSSLQETKKWYH